MRFPWANILLLTFLALELVSGFFGLTSGSENRAIHMQLHRIAGYGILITLVWKTANVLRSLKWDRPVPARTASLVLSVLLVVCLATGIAWSLVGPYGWWIFSGVSWHIYVGAAIVPLLVWHIWYMARGFPVAFWADRRLFLRTAGAFVWDCGVAGIRAHSKGCRPQRPQSQVHRLIQGQGLLRQRFPARLMAQRQPRSRRLRDMAAESIRLGEAKN